MKTILLSRTDRIGDVILTLPMAGMIKKHFPEYKVLFLCRKYTREVVSRCAAIDAVFIWEDVKRGEVSLPLVDYFIHVLPDREIACFARSGRARHRIGTSHRLYHWLTCNRLVNFSRKRSDLHESQLNMKLLLPLGVSEIPSLSEMHQLIRWERTNNGNPSGLLSHKFNLILHIKSMGSAKEWPPGHFLRLARELPQELFHIYVTGTSAEGDMIRKEIPEMLSLSHVTDLTGKYDLIGFISFIEQCDGLLACSTGPLHIASVAGLKTLGLYPAKRPMHADRWAPIGAFAQALSEGKSSHAHQLDIPVKNVRERIEQWI